MSETILNLYKLIL